MFPILVLCLQVLVSSATLAAHSPSIPALPAAQDVSKGLRATFNAIVRLVVHFALPYVWDVTPVMLTFNL